MPRRPPRFAAATVAVLVATAVPATAACGGDGDVAPDAAPAEVVERALGLTRAGAPVRVVLTDGRDERSEVVDLDGSGADASVDAPVVALLDDIRRADRVLSYGGQQIRGVATFRYDVRVRRGGVPETLGVWLDRDGRFRRVQARTLPPTTVPGGLPRLTVVDFVDFDIAPGGSPADAPQEGS